MKRDFFILQFRERSLKSWGRCRSLYQNEGGAEAGGTLSCSFADLQFWRQGLHLSKILLSIR